MNDRTTKGTTTDVATQSNELTSSATMLDVAGAPSIASILEARNRQVMADFADFAGFNGSGAQ